jgi:hypothetical protein
LVKVVKVNFLIPPNNVNIDVNSGLRTPTFSSQIAALRNFLAASSDKTNIFRRVLSVDLPLAVETGNKVDNSKL